MEWSIGWASYYRNPLGCIIILSSILKFACCVIVAFSHFIIVPTVNFNQSTYNADEDDGPAQPVLVLSNPSSTDITVNVFSTDGSATGKDYTFNFNPLKICGTGGGVDYSSGPYNVTIATGQMRVPFDVPINDDNVFEGNEEILLIIDQASSLNGVIIGSPKVAVVNILDNDGEFM